MFLREIATHFRNLQVQITIDNELLQHIDSVDRLSTNRTITFNLYKLIYAIGTIQTRRFAPSNRMKFLDKADLVEKIYTNTNDFKVKIQDIRNNGGQEVLTTISEDFGVGISVVIAEKLFNIKYSTIQRIYGTDKRPDWKCQTNDNRTLIIESKGASSQATSDRQEARALIQKNRRNGDVKIASLTLINENQISTNRYLDPPIEPDNMDSEMQNRILRAGHYSSVFSFLGISVLSKYYSQMRNRLMNIISQQEQYEKNQIYFQLRDEFPNITFDGKLFTGNFYAVDNEKYLFVGIDKRLISYEGFLQFDDYENEINESRNENNYILFKDGILIIEINNISFFENVISPNQIFSFQENITISDVDSMTEKSFEKYVGFLLKENGFEIQKELRIQDTVADIIGTKDNERYIFELKLFKRKRISIDFLNQLSQYQGLENVDRVVLITNALINRTEVSNFDNIILIDREKLKKILKNREILNEILNK